MTMSFRYVALDAGGRKVRGAIEADTALSAQDVLDRQGLAALRLERAWTGAGVTRAASGVSLTRRDMASFLYDLGALTEAGVDFRSALGVLGQAEDRRSATARMARALEQEIAQGSALDAAFSKVFGRAFPAVAGLVAAGQASGGLAQALTRGSENLEQDLDAADGMVAAMSYPGFILLMTLAAVLIILLFVVPSLAPLAQQSQHALPAGLASLFRLSAMIRSNGPSLLAIGVVGATVLAAGWRLGFIRKPLETWLLDGPAAAICRGLVFGGAASSLGVLITAKVPASDAIQLAQRGCSLVVARERLLSCAVAVREGAAVSEALRSCKGVPRRVVRMAMVGEQAGRLGPMLDRAGALERRRALRRIRSISQWLGPVLIIVLGGLVGLIMASLLSSITALADTATAS